VVTGITLLKAWTVQGHHHIGRKSYRLRNQMASMVEAEVVAADDAPAEEDAEVPRKLHLAQQAALLSQLHR
jgi:hypothetical protein